MTDNIAGLIAWLGTIALFVALCCAGAGLDAASRIAGVIMFALFVTSWAAMGMVRP